MLNTVQRCSSESALQLVITVISPSVSTLPYLELIINHVLGSLVNTGPLGFSAKEEAYVSGCSFAVR